MIGLAKYGFACNTRLALKRSPTLYPVVLRLKGLSDREFPGPDTELHLTGFPRSGNTYCTALARVLFPQLEICSHIHAVASLKMALAMRVPIIVLLRRPSEAISSMAVKFGVGGSETGWLRCAAREYEEYYRFVEDNLSRIQVLPFEHGVEQPSRLVRAVRMAVGRKGRLSTHDLQHAAAEVRFRLRRSDSSRDASKHSLPVHDKEQEKQAFRDVLPTMSAFAAARETYGVLRSSVRST